MQKAKYFPNFFVLTASTALSFYGYSQTLIIQTLRDTSHFGSIYSFPLLTSIKSPAAAEKINQYLQISELEIYIGQEDSSIFEKIWPLRNSFGGITEFEFYILTSSENILSIEFSKEGCGAYCEHFTSYYNFDVKTGNLINIKDIFTDEGLKHLAQIISNERKKLIEKTISGLSDRTEEEVETIKDIYHNCLEYITEANFHKEEYFIEDNRIHFIRERCSNHALRALDEIGDFENIKSFTEVAKYLNGYGQSLLK